MSPDQTPHNAGHGRNQSAMACAAPPSTSQPGIERETDVTTTTTAIELLLVDDHEMVRECLRSHLERQHRLKVLGEAAHGDDALHKIKILQPDVVLLDVDMPTAIAFSTLERIQRDWPELKVVVITSQ